MQIISNKTLSHTSMYTCCDNTCLSVRGQWGVSVKITLDNFSYTCYRHPHTSLCVKFEREHRESS